MGFNARLRLVVPAFSPDCMSADHQTLQPASYYRALITRLRKGQRISDLPEAVFCGQLTRQSRVSEPAGQSARRHHVRVRAQPPTRPVPVPGPLAEYICACMLQVCHLRSVLSAWRDTAAAASAAVSRLKAAWVARRRAALLLQALAGWHGECCAARVRSARALARAHAAVLRRALCHWHAAAAHARQRRRLAALCEHQASALLGRPY